MIGVLEALEGMVGFLGSLEKRDAADGFRTHKDGIMSTLKHSLATAQEAEELEIALRIFTNVLEFCVADPEDHCWMSILAELRQNPFYLTALGHAGRLFLDIAPVRGVLQKLGLHQNLPTAASF